MTTDGGQNRAGLLVGVLIAVVVPLSTLIVASLWDRGILDLEPNGPFVQTLQAVSFYGIVLGPVGIVVAGRSARISGYAWISLFIVAVPMLFALWFVSVAYLGGLAGEPF
jgi:hypothetical protein